MATRRIGTLVALLLATVACAELQDILPLLPDELETAPAFLMLLVATGADEAAPLVGEARLLLTGRASTR